MATFRILIHNPNVTRVRVAVSFSPEKKSFLTIHIPEGETYSGTCNEGLWLSCDVQGSGVNELIGQVKYDNQEFTVPQGTYDD